MQSTMQSPLAIKEKLRIFPLIIKIKDKDTIDFHRKVERKP